MIIVIKLGLNKVIKRNITQSEFDFKNLCEDLRCKLSANLHTIKEVTTNRWYRKHNSGVIVF